MPRKSVPKDYLERILKTYRPDGPIKFLPVEELRRNYRHYRLDPKTPQPWIFDIEARSHFRQQGLVDLFTRMEIARNHRVLSLGEGNGAPSRLLAKLKGCRVTGVDLNPASVAGARKLARLHGVSELLEYLEQDVHGLELGRRAFDRLYMNETTCHWRDRERALRRALRYLRPGALIGINEWTMGNEGDLDDAYRKIKGFGEFYGDGIWYQPTLEALARLLRKHGCRVLERTELTEVIDTRVRRWVKALEGIYEALDDFERLGVRYLKVMLKTHHRFLRYGRVVARAP